MDKHSLINQINMRGLFNVEYDGDEYINGYSKEQLYNWFNSNNNFLSTAVLNRINNALIQGYSNNDVIRDTLLPHLINHRGGKKSRIFRKRKTRRTLKKKSRRRSRVL
jgi:hypothetical protein